MNVIETIKENAQANRFQKEHFMKEEFFTCLLPKKWKFFRSEVFLVVVLLVIDSRDKQRNIFHISAR
jgi:hypothetical protein